MKNKQILTALSLLISISSFALFYKTTTPLEREAKLNFVEWQGNIRDEYENETPKFEFSYDNKNIQLTSLNKFKTLRLIRLISTSPLIPKLSPSNSERELKLLSFSKKFFFPIEKSSLEDLRVQLLIKLITEYNEEETKNGTK